MSLTHGLDPAKVREVAAAFRRIAESATEVQDGVTATVHQLAQVWVGPDLEHFDRSWQVYARQLEESRDRLARFGEVLEQQASDQEQTSGGARGGGGGGWEWPDIHLPGLPKLELPTFDVDWPDIGWPRLDWPDIHLPEIPYDLTWFEALAMPFWFWIAPPSVQQWYMQQVDGLTSWANDLWKKYLSDNPAVNGVQWLLRKGGDGAKWLSDLPWWAFPGAPHAKFVWGAVADELYTWDRVLEDPKGWWANASGLDQLGMAASVVPGAGAAAKGLIKGGKTLINVLRHTDEAAELLRRGDEAAELAAKHGDDAAAAGRRMDDGWPLDETGRPVPSDRRVDLSDEGGVPEWARREEPNWPQDGAPDAPIYDRSMDPYGGMDRQEFYDRYFDEEAGSWRYPNNDGFDGPRVPNTLQPGDIIDRTGPPSGRFAAPDGTPFGQRALPPSDIGREYHRYEVVRPLPPEVTQGEIAPWFNQPGGGTQYHFGDHDIQWYIDNGYLREVT